MLVVAFIIFLTKAAVFFPLVLKCLYIQKGCIIKRNISRVHLLKNDEKIIHKIYCVRVKWKKKNEEEKMQVL